MNEATISNTTNNQEDDSDERSHSSSDDDHLVPGVQMNQRVQSTIVSRTRVIVVIRVHGGDVID